MKALSAFLDSPPFMPHGHCYYWTKNLIALHTISDALIVLAYFSIPITLVYFVRKRKDIQFNWMFVCFAVFIMACGTTHLMEIWNIWHANYWLSGVIKAITALASVPTAMLLVKLVPVAVALPSTTQLNRVNEALQAEIAERKQVEAQLHEANAGLDRRVQERTEQLAQTNAALRDSQQLLQAIIDNSPAVIYVKDLQGRYLLINRRYEEIFHLPRSRVLGKKDHDFFPEAVADKFRAVDERVAAAGHALTEEEEAPHDDGPHAYISVKCPLRDTTGKCYAVFGISTDITDQKRSQEKIAWLASYPEYNPNPIVELDPATGIIHYANPVAIEILPDLQTLGLQHPWLAGLETIARQMIETHTGAVRREMILGKSCYAQTVHYVPETKQLRIYSADITDRKQAEELIKASLKEIGDLKAALDEHAIVAITDPQGKITYVNDKFCSISKYSREELLGQDHRLINSKHHPKEFIHDLWMTITHGKVWKGEIKNRAKDGSFYWVDTTIVPFLNADGKPRQYVAIRADITQRKLAEEWLKASLKETGDLRAALDEHAIVAITDPQGKITYVNDKFCAISQYSREKLLGQDHRLINSGHHSKEFICDLWTTITHGKVWKGEIKNRAKDGSFYWVATTIVPFLNELGKPRQYVAIRADITERKLAEEKIRLLNTDLEQRVAERTAELESFSYSVSHDLRAPLRAMGGYARMLQEDLGLQLPAEAAHKLERIYDNSNKMGQLIDGLLAFSRLSRQPLKKQKVSSASVTQRVLEELQSDQAGRQIKISVGNLPDCLADATLLQQVFTNLISNALKYTRQRDQALVEIGWDNLHRAYFVKDNGAGFDMQYAGKLFGVFQRLHRADEFEGTGVGLAIVQRIVYRHGGKIWAEAERDKGATFYFTLGEDGLNGE